MIKDLSDDIDQLGLFPGLQNYCNAVEDSDYGQNNEQYPKFIIIFLFWKLRFRSAYLSDTYDGSFDPFVVCVFTLIKAVTTIDCSVKTEIALFHRQKFIERSQVLLSCYRLQYIYK